MLGGRCETTSLSGGPKQDRTSFLRSLLFRQPALLRQQGARKSLEDCGHYLIRKVRSLSLRLSDSRRGFPAGKSVGGSKSPTGTPHKGHRPLQSHLPRALPMPDRRTGHDGVRGAKVVVDLDRCGSLVNNKDTASHGLPFAARIERAADERNHPIFRHSPCAETPARALI